MSSGKLRLMPRGPLTFSAMGASFDPTGAVLFDLDRGRIEMAGGGASLMLPAAVLAQLCARASADELRAVGATLGKQAATRILARMGDGARPSLQEMVDELGGELGLLGLGTLGIERWGRSLVVQVGGCPLGGAGGSLLAGFVESAIVGSTGRQLRAALVDREADSPRMLLCSPDVGERVEGWIAAGRGFGEALTALHEAGGAVGSSAGAGNR